MCLPAPNATRDPAGTKEPDAVGHPGMNDDSRARPRTIPSDERPSQYQAQTVFKKAAMVFIFNWMDGVANHPIAELAGRPEKRVGMGKMARNENKPKELKIFVINEIDEILAKQTHREYPLIL